MVKVAEVTPVFRRRRPSKNWRRRPGSWLFTFDDREFLTLPLDRGGVGGEPARLDAAGLSKPRTGPRSWVAHAA